MSDWKLSRRAFLKTTGALGAAAAIGGTRSTLLVQSGSVVKAQASEKDQEKIIPTICGGCHNNCGMLVHVVNDRITFIEGNPDHPMNKGALCASGSAMRELVYSPDRLKAPLKRVGERGEGKFEAISWDEAIDLMAEKLSEIAEKYGPETLFYGFGAPVMNNCRNAFREFYARFGTPNSWVSDALCYVPRAVVLVPTYGYRDEEDYNNTNLIINWGGNPLASMRPGTYACYGKKGFITPILDARDRGAKLIVIDPVCTETAAKADWFIPIRPGTDGALALAMLNVIINNRLYDEDFVSNWTYGFDQLRDHVQQYTTTWASEVTGIPAEDIESLATIYATTKPATIHEANTFANHTNNCQAVRAIGCLKAITGNLEVAGGNVCWPSSFGDFVTPVEMGSPVGIKTTVVPEKPHIAAERYPLNAGGAYMIESAFTGQPYKPRALMLYHSNPVLAGADTNRLIDFMRSLEFSVVMDIFMTRTCEEADLVLPDVSLLENYDYRTYPSAEGVVIALRQPAAAAMYDCRSFFEVEYDLAKRMGLGDNYPWTNVEEFFSYALSPNDLDLAKLKDSPIQVLHPYEYYGYKTGRLRPDGAPGFNTPSGKVELYCTKLEKLGYDPLPTYTEPAESPISTPETFAQYPLIGVNRRCPEFVHFKYRNIPRLRELQPDPLVRLNPKDAAARGISSGDWVIIESPRGQIRQKAEVTERTQPGIAWIDGGWGNSWDNRDAAYNTLTDRTKLDPIGNNASISSFLCQIVRE